MCLTVIILLAASGAGIMGAIMPNMRDRYMDNEVKTEMAENREEESEEEMKEALE